MKASIQTTVGELIAVLFDETQNLHWLKTREKQLLVAFLVNDMVQRSIFNAPHRVATTKR